jgi:uncharacterized membrane protein YeaQ/YmgE (transglycosylase-associated protein family)
MGIIAWIILGGVAGWLASILTGTDQDMGVGLNIVVGIIGAFVGGLLFSLVGGSGVTGFNLWSLLVAVAGGAVLLLLLKAFRRA